MSVFRHKRDRCIGLVLTLILVASVLSITIPAYAVGSSVPAPDQDGQYDVGWYTVDYWGSYGRYTAIIYYPARWNGWRAAKDSSDGPYPGIVVGNGFMGSDWNITWIPKRLASHGYVAMVFTPPIIVSPDTGQWACGFSEGIDELRSQNSRWFSPVRRMVNTSKFGIIGFSMGGAGVTQAAAYDPEVDVAVGLAPANMDIPLADAFFDPVRDAAANLHVPTMFQVGSNDGIVQPQWVQDLYDYIPATTTSEYVEIAGGNHVGYVDTWVYDIAGSLVELIDGENTIGAEEQHRVASKYFTAWFNYHLKGQSGYYDYIFGAEPQNDLNAGVLSGFESN